MKKTLQFLALSFVISVSAYGQAKQDNSSLPSQQDAKPIQNRLISSDINSSLVTCNTFGFNLNEVSTPKGIQSILDVPEGIPLNVKGAPDLRRVATGLIIPNQGSTQVTIVSSNYKEYKNIDIAPSKGVLLISQDPSTIPFEYGEAYNKDAFFPGNLVELRDPHIMRNVRGQYVDVYPYQYNPVTKVLRVYSDITYKITSNENEIGINEMENSTARTVPSEFKDMYESHYLNFQSASSKISGVTTNSNGRMLIICYDNFKANIQPFVNWKTLKGIQVEVVLKSVVGTTAASVLTYLKNYYTKYPDFTYLVIVGDAPQIPSFMDGQYASEQNYSMLVGNDKNPEIVYGRISAETTNDVDMQVKKFITYEKYPNVMATGRFSTSATISLKLGPDNSTNVYLDMKAVKTALTPAGYTFTELFESNLGTALPTAANMTSAINAGQGFMSWISHGSKSGLVSFPLTTTNINTSKNTDMWPMIWNCSCNTGDFTTGSACFAESWLRASSNGKPVGAIGTAMSSHEMPMGPSEKYGSCAAKYLVDATHKNKTYGGITVDTYIKTAIQDYNQGNEFAWMGMFADPSLMLRTKAPLSMTCTHKAADVIGITSLVVGSNAPDGYISLTQKNKIIGTGYVVNGTTTISFPALTSTDTVFVTGTAFNYAPYLGYVLITTATGIADVDQNSTLKVYPSPNNGIFTIDGLNGENTIEIVDVLGKLVYETNSKNTSVMIDINDKDKGVYFYKIVNSSTKSISKGKILIN